MVYETRADDIFQQAVGQPGQGHRHEKKHQQLRDIDKDHAAPQALLTGMQPGEQENPCTRWNEGPAGLSDLVSTPRVQTPRLQAGSFSVK